MEGHDVSLVTTNSPNKLLLDESEQLLLDATKSLELDEHVHGSEHLMVPD